MSEVIADERSFGASAESTLVSVVRRPRRAHSLSSVGFPVGGAISLVVRLVTPVVPLLAGGSALRMGHHLRRSVAG